MALDEIPEEFRAGQTFDALISLVAYPASVWTGTLKFRPINGLIPDVVGTDVNDSHQFDVDETVTLTWPAGIYKYIIEVEDAPDVIFAEEGQIEILAAPDAIAGDQRTHAQIVLANIEAVLQNKATKDQMEYSLHDRSLKRYTFAELMELRDKYKTEVAREAEGGSTIKRVDIRFC